MNNDHNGQAAVDDREHWLSKPSDRSPLPDAHAPGLVAATGAAQDEALRASRQDGTYPRPQMVRQQWISLDGLWDFAFDDRDEGRAAGWYLPGAAAFNRRIQVPFPPESAASGVGDDAPHRTLWYRRTIELIGGPRWILHFGAVDQEADIYVDGRHVGGHTGGQTAFSIDITDAVDPAVDKHTLVVRAYDDPTDTEVPRGKQDWRNQPHFIWYRRTSGIWRTVWLEQVPSLHITSIEWHPNSDAATVRAVIRLSAQPTEPAAVTVAVAANGKTLGSTVVTAHNARVIVTLELPPLRNAQEREQYFWEPDHPVLLDANIVLTAGATVDRVASYFAFRTVGVQRDAFLLNNRPWFVRAVLEQGYWTDSHLTPPSVAALRQEVDLIRDLGFNTARIHQKVEDPRFLYWADRLGLMVWVETAAAYEYTPRAASRITAEWIEIVEQHRNHPCVVTWVPVNESWGVQEVGSTTAQQQFVQSLASLTRALDPTRPVVSNDGWEHVDSDIITVHDYSTDPVLLRQHFDNPVALTALIQGIGPQGRATALGHQLYKQSPLEAGKVAVMVSEFGGVAYSTTATWGYAVVESLDEYAQSLIDLFSALQASPYLAGMCYTQFTDTLQESNGLVTADRKPKLTIERLRGIITGGATVALVDRARLDV